jgi:hypothetical protein
VCDGIFVFSYSSVRRATGLSFCNAFIIKEYPENVSELFVIVQLTQKKVNSFQMPSVWFACLTGLGVYF